MKDQQNQQRRQLLERARQNMVAVAALFEGSLAVLAWFLGWMFGYPPVETIKWNLADLGYGLLWTLPLIPTMWIVGRSRWRPFVRIQQIISAIIVPLFSGCTLLQLALISLLAGFGEEALFRGFVQNSIEQEGNLWGAIAVASILFGLAHMITPAYAIIAMLIGVYLGWLMHFHDNLLVAITVHAVYDFIALVYLVRINPRSQVVLDRTMRDMEKMLAQQDVQLDELIGEQTEQSGKSGEGGFSNGDQTEHSGADRAQADNTEEK